MVGIQALDVRGHLVGPGAQQVRRAVGAAGEVAGPVCAAARLVGEFPCKHGGRVLVPVYHGFDVVLVGVFDGRQSVEVVVVFAAQVHGVDVHAAIVGPVVGQGDDELDAFFGGGVDHFVKGRDVDGGFAVGEPLEDDFVRTSIAILRKTTRDCGCVFVVEAPCTEDIETCLFGCGQTLFDICLCLRWILLVFK